ncbi:MAG: hypothetical protein JXQ80_10850, partial [Bacteroidales bacterium]|nr:hypothetical protein [Bacteroidales bacterium]
PWIYLGVTGTPVFYLLFVLQYTHTLPKINLWHYVMLLFIPGITLIGTFTNPFHHLVYDSARLINTNLAGITTAVEMRWLGWVFTGYSYTLIGFSLIVLFRSLYLSPRRYATQVKIIIFSIMFPITGNLLFVFVPGTTEFIDLTPVGFSIAGALLLTGMKQYGLLRIKPLGREFLFDSLEDGVLFMDVRNQIIDYNKSASNILGIRFGKDMIKNSQKIIRKYPGFYQKCLSDEMEIIEFQFSSDADAFYHVQIHKLLDNWNSVIGKVIVLHNVTDLKKNRDIITAQNAELARLNKQKDRMISIISHDLRSPLASVITLLEMLKLKNNSLSEEDLKAMFSNVINRAQTTFDLLENLLQWSKSEAGKISYETEPLDLSMEITSVINTYSGLARDKDIALNVVENNLQQPVIVANKQLFRTVMRNLITNAIKFTPDMGQITVQYQYRKTDCLISVSDSGVGIAPERMEKIQQQQNIAFTPGTRGESGSGLGLTLCKEFVARMGGKLFIESQAGKGTCISFTLPYAA